MSARSVAHATFVIERTFAAPAARVFAAWSDAETKRAWAGCHDDWRLDEHRLDFHVDGTEVFQSLRGKTRMTFTEQVTFLDGHGDADERREGTEAGLANLDRVLSRS
jgi:uncharacterized protein YndB with AHSA1/START domain